MQLFIKKIRNSHMSWESNNNCTYTHTHTLGWPYRPKVTSAQYFVILNRPPSSPRDLPNAYAVTIPSPILSPLSSPFFHINLTHSPSFFFLSLLFSLSSPPPPRSIYLSVIASFSLVVSHFSIPHFICPLCSTIFNSSFFLKIDLPIMCVAFTHL